MINDKNVKEQEIIDEAYKVSKEINEICDRSNKREDDKEDYR